MFKALTYAIACLALLGCGTIWQKPNIVILKYKQERGGKRPLKMRDKLKAAEFVNGVFPSVIPEYASAQDVHIYALMAHLAYTTYEKPPHKCMKKLGLVGGPWDKFDDKGARKTPIDVSELKNDRPTPWFPTSGVGAWQYVESLSFSFDSDGKKNEEGEVVKVKPYRRPYYSRPYVSDTFEKYQDCMQHKKSERCIQYTICQISEEFCANDPMSQVVSIDKKARKTNTKRKDGHIEKLNFRRGLTYDVWLNHEDINASVQANGERKKDRYVIVFRGTDFTSVSDWASNFRWLIPKKNNVDQYDQVKLLTARLIDIFAKTSKDRYLKGKAYSPEFEVIAVGHSLGGGLAQQAGYADARIKEVFAFHTSPVTAFAETPDATKNAKGQTTFRIHESGEILAAIRPVTEFFYIFSNSNSGVKDPQILKARYDAITTYIPFLSLTKNHDIGKFACALNEFKNGTVNSDKN